MDGFYDEQALRLSDELERAYELAVQLAENAELQAVFEQAARDPELRLQLAESATKALDARGVRVPEEIDVNFLERRVLVRPVPDVERFAIRLTNCRTYWVRKEDDAGYEEVQVCFGFEIVPRGFSPIG
jgi:hypothetical protein